MSKNVQLFSSYHSELKSSEKGSFFELIASGQKAEKRVPFLTLYCAEAESKQKGVLSDEDFLKD